MNEECLICGAPLEYLENDVQMECAVCHKKENSKTRCVRGHYVCNDCHTAGLDAIVGLCLNESSKNPVEILEKMMALSFCHMHGPEHHVMVGAALLTAYKNAGGALDLPKALGEMINRGKKVPGGACGFWGACGAGISSGMFISIASGSTPLSVEPFALSHKMTAKSLAAIGEIGGPRCCKRDSFLSILAAIDFAKEHLGVEMEKPEIVCTHFSKNNQCIGKRCPFSPCHKVIAQPKAKKTDRQQTVQQQPMVFFWKDTEENGCFSNWYRRPFVIDGVQYPHVEQYMMSQKAKLFHDEVRYAAILRTENPNDCKKLGKQVTPFDPKTWDGAKYEIVKAGNRAKFEQNPDLKEKLLATGTAILAEASPRDKTWGIGKTAKTAAETDPSAWPGQNLLGKILMELREEFAANPTTASLQEK